MQGHTKQADDVSAQAPSQQLLPTPQSASVWQLHFPFTQVLLFAQTLPQLPQFCAELNGVSQPSPGSRLQSAKPVSHCIMRHVPVAHWPWACAGAQARSHAPQSVALFNERSQPSAGSPLQSAKPGRHCMLPQLPALHAADATFASVVQSFMHLPHVAALDKSASQPFALAPSQSARPLPHTWLHLPSWQLEDSTPPICVAHTLVQLPHVAGKLKSASQPSARLLLQLWRRSLHWVI
jgi:hypothetical protein